VEHPLKVVLSKAKAQQGNASHRLLPRQTLQSSTIKKSSKRVAQKAIITLLRELKKTAPEASKWAKLLVVNK